ncbi:hypothetical protein CGGC5_v017080 [Colletotrichum fructicola Nara gc5]|uniref:Uncharacterized protein n=1 Tax=Colletotrichum fructicola (strain Nara gc5) TaxID=1213859 RepID=A0A7J6ICE6_COLFN|nr:hypothetical protein CGGC5_v017080 [Colletotrichum fructicola Nara gc5]
MSHRVSMSSYVMYAASERWWKVRQLKMNILRDLWQQWPSMRNQSCDDPIDYSTAEIKGHRSVQSIHARYEMHVLRWTSPARTRVERWEPEGFVQLRAPELLFRYWKSAGGRTCGEHWYPLLAVGDKTTRDGGKAW